MSLTKIFTNEEASAEDKVAAIAVIVTKARNAYGNTEAEVESADVVTTEGCTDLELLSAKDKVALAEREVASIKREAVELSKYNDGIVLDKEIERLIALSPLLCNITKTVDSEYI